MARSPSCSRPWYRCLVASPAGGLALGRSVPPSPGGAAPAKIVSESTNNKRRVNQNKRTVDQAHAHVLALVPVADRLLAPRHFGAAGLSASLGAFIALP